MRRLRVGLIGTGTIANSAHLPAIAHLHEELELVAVADIRPEMAEKAAKEYGASAWYSDYRELLARPDIDFVDICTPEFLHREQVVAAAEAGKHIHCEKPMSSTVEEADAMIEAARRNGVKLMIGHSRRFTPSLPAHSRGDRARRDRRGAHRPRERAPRGVDVHRAQPLGRLLGSRRGSSMDRVGAVHARRRTDERGARDRSGALVRRTGWSRGLRRGAHPRSARRSARHDQLHHHLPERRDRRGRGGEPATHRLPLLPHDGSVWHRRNDPGHRSADVTLRDLDDRRDALPDQLRAAHSRRRSLCQRATPVRRQCSRRYPGSARSVGGTASGGPLGGGRRVESNRPRESRSPRPIVREVRDERITTDRGHR